MTIELRPYQNRAVTVTHESLRRNRRVICCLPTGSGKRLIGVWWTMLGTERGRKILVVTNRRILVEQMADECRARGVPYGIVMGDAPRNDEALVQIASVQTLQHRKWQDMPEANLLIVDECHQDSAAYSTLFDLYPTAKVIGLTATPVGAQGRSLIGLYDQLVEPIKNRELIAGGWLLPTKVIAPSEPDIEGVTIQDGKEYNQQQLGERVESCTVFADVFQWWEPYSDMQTLCFVPRLKFAYGIAEQFQKRGFAAEVIEGGTSKKDRHALFEDYRNLDKRVLISVDVLREGLDLPVAQVGIDLQPNSQFRTWWQKLGRVRRPHGDQDRAIWLDFAGNVWRHVLHPDDDPPWAEVTSNLTTQDVIGKKAGRVCPECGGHEIYKGKCQDCGHQVVPTKAPWCCPKCSYTLSPWERMIDGICPNCGSKASKPIRRIRMGDGTMRTVAMNEVSTVKKARASREQSVWDKYRYIAFYSGKTLEFARQMYRREMGDYPRDLKHMPDDPDSGDWKRAVAAVMPWMGNRKKG